MENWGRAKKEWLESFLKLPNGIPSHDTFNRVFSMIKPEQFHKVFIEWVEAVTEKIEGVVAIDGKTIRRSMDGSSGKRAIHVVSAWAEVLSAEKKAMAEKGCYSKEYSGEHGRIEEREYYVEHDIEWMEQKKDWKGIQGIGMCHTKVEKGGETTESYSYAIFSKKGMSAEEFGKGKRDHWKIENVLHWVLDIAYREDESRARKENSVDA